MRNNLAENKSKLPNPGEYTKTGTTICGVVFPGGVVLAADTRATAGTVVADKNCMKIEPIAKNMYCAGAGTAADLFYVKRNFF